MLGRVVTIAAIVAAASVPQVRAHGYMYQPLTMFFSSSAFDVTSYVSTIDAYSLYPDGTFNTDPADNVASFVSNFENQTTYANIKELIMANQVLISDLVTEDCGYSDPSQTSYGSLNSTVLWGANGFTSSHEGPCEVWCDDNMAAQDMDCAADYPSVNGGPSEVPIDNSVCTSASRLTFYWIAMHGSTWQVYINCVNINGATSASTTAGADSTTPPAVSSGETSTTTSTTTTSSTSSASTATEAPTSTTATPTTTTAAPTTTTAAPATSSTTSDASESSIDEDADVEEMSSTASTSEEEEETTSGSEEEEETPATTTEAPATTTEAPASTTATPASTTATPASTTACRRRMRN